MSNVAVGYRTLFSSSASIVYNTAIGYTSQYYMQGSSNTGVGKDAIRGSIITANNLGSYNTGIGYEALQVLSSGDSNTAIGSYAGYALTTGDNNTLIGSASGGSISTGIKNTILGSYTGSAALTSTVVLSDGDGNVQLYATGSKVAIGKTATPNATLDVTGSAIITGSLTVTGNIVNILGMGFVSCSLAVVSSSNLRTFSASFKDVDGTSLPRPQQLIHWWTSTAETGSASAVGTGVVSYIVASGSNVVPISNSGSINHAVTDNNGNFAVRLVGGIAAPTTVWFNTEVQGIIYSISTTISASSG
jgi:hypothetical protein